MYRRANKFSNRVLDTPKLEGKPQDCTQPRSVSTRVDNAALSTLQSRLARLEHHLCREQSPAIAGSSRKAPVASLIDLCTPGQPQVPLSFEERRILSKETSIPGTSGLAHVSPVQADATVATAHSRGQPKPSEMLRKTLQKAHLPVPIMNKWLDMLVKVLFLQAFPPKRV